MKYKTLLGIAISRGSGIVFNFIFTIYLAKFLGAKEAGIVFFSITLITLTSLITRFGFDHILMKIISPLWKKKKNTDIISSISYSMIVMASISVIVYILLRLILSYLFNLSYLSHELFNISSSALIYIFPLGTLWALSSALKAMQSPNLAGFIESGSIPLLTLVLMLIMHLNDQGTNSAHVVFYFGISTIIITLIIFFIVLKKNNYKFSIQKNDKIHNLIKANLKSCFRIMIMSLSNYALIWLPVFYLTILVSEESAGIYSTLQRIAMLISFILIIFNSILAPKFSVLYKENKHPEMENLTVSSIKKMLMLAIPIVILILLFSGKILSQLGEEFINSGYTLHILVLTQLISVFFGPVIYILTMTGNEHAITKTTLMLFLSSIFHCLVLVYSMSLVGAAVSTLINITFLNYRAQQEIKKSLGISTNLTFNKA